MRWSQGILIALLLSAGVAQAKPLDLQGSFVQGGLLRGQVPPGSDVRFAGRKLRLDPEGRFLLGFGRDAVPEESLIVRYPDGSRTVRRFEIGKRDYQIQRINGLPPRQVSPGAEDLVKIAAEAKLIAAANRRDSAGRGIAPAFVWPVTGPISGVYGSQRILNGKARAPHRGVDIAAPPGTPVGAMAAGVVTVAAPDMYFTGNTVMIDHGYGLHSVYAHLSELGVAVGQAVDQGTPIGRVGATGRVTGAHLHWGVYWFDQALDPALLVGPMPQS